MGDACLFSGLSSVALGVMLGSCTPDTRPVKSAASYDVPPATSARSAGPQPAAESLPTRASVENTGAVVEPAEPEAPNASVRPAPAFTHPMPQLASFYDAVEALQQGKRTRPVRVLWLGDSHTAADFMTHPIRKHLSGLVSDGGAGFFRLGLDGYRHGAVRLSKSGRWRKAPILPAQRTRVLDGVFGYGGIRTLPAAGARAGAELRESGEGQVRWTLSYRLPKGARLRVQLGEQRHVLEPEESGTPGEILESSWVAPSAEKLSVAHVSGDPQIFGAYAEREAPGVVFDTVGINGARAATPLAWEPDQWVFQVKNRQPDLLALAFGTNEVFDRTSPHRYEQHLIKLVGLAREARPELPCWVIGPPDSAAKNGGSKERVLSVSEVLKATSQSLGCAYTSAFELMGGEGSFSRWMRERPAKARSDRIHLTIAGYEALGVSLAESLITAHDAGSADSADPTAEKK